MMYAIKYKWRNHTLYQMHCKREIVPVYGQLQ